MRACDLKFGYHDWSRCKQRFYRDPINCFTSHACCALWLTLCWINMKRTEFYWYTACPRSLIRFYSASRPIKMHMTFWTYGSSLKGKLSYWLFGYQGHFWLAVTAGLADLCPETFSIILAFILHQTGMRMIIGLI